MGCGEKIPGTALLAATARGMEMLDLTGHDAPLAGVGIHAGDLQGVGGPADGPEHEQDVPPGRAGAGRQRGQRGVADLLDGVGVAVGGLEEQVERSLLAGVEFAMPAPAPR